MDQLTLRAARLLQQLERSPLARLSLFYGMSLASRIVLGDNHEAESVFFNTLLFGHIFDTHSNHYSVSSSAIESSPVAPNPGGRNKSTVKSKPRSIIRKRNKSRFDMANGQQLKLFTGAPVGCQSNLNST